MNSIYLFIKHTAITNNHHDMKWHTQSSLFADSYIVDCQKKSVTKHIFIMKQIYNLAFILPVLLWPECGLGGGERGETMLMPFFPIYERVGEQRLKCRAAIRLKGLMRP